MKHNQLLLIFSILLSGTFAYAWQLEKPKDPMSATRTQIDRFSDEAGHLFRRSANPNLPMPNEAINFDQQPFVTDGFAPQGDYISYYNFDVDGLVPAPIYVLFKDGEDMPVAGQLNLVDVIPGDQGYNDFWNVVKVTVPSQYQANQITSVAELEASGFKKESTHILVNCPIVPKGSVATRRYNNNADTGLHMGWYRNTVITYFNFSERALMVTSKGHVPTSPIYVMFNKNPNSMDMSSGPASGFVIDQKTGRTHNVAQTIPEQQAYSPLWYVNVIDNIAFSAVHDLNTVSMAPVLAKGVATVNCPIVARSMAQ